MRDRVGTIYIENVKVIQETSSEGFQIEISRANGTKWTTTVPMEFFIEAIAEGTPVYWRDCEADPWDLAFYKKRVGIDGHAVYRYRDGEMMSGSANEVRVVVK